jgi:hypothetical protein
MRAGAWARTLISAAPVAVTNGFVASANMLVGAYTLAATAPTFGARHVTLVRTVVTAADTPGTVDIVGTDLSGQTILETMTPGATGVTVTSTKFFASILSMTGVGWVINGTADTIIFGWDALNAVATGSGVFHAVVVNTTAAGAITISDAGGTIAVLKTSIAEGFYGPYDAAFSGFLRVEPAAASNITVLHSGSLPQTYSM